MTDGCGTIRTGSGADRTRNPAIAARGVRSGRRGDATSQVLTSATAGEAAMIRAYDRASRNIRPRHVPPGGRTLAA
ncbi:hypothetical protein GCM10025864_12360 [Luteimicrobium album]|uniref:Uncharacterized protein n=1 Tax=Luteimicrobium album TaxID=1054550 RepID=A0ABQ6HZR0_9MICO|nr:hypothetical protein GCM10025864_12360 [Luteimicrobium album]